MRIAGVILIGLSLGACSVARQAEEKVSFESNPSGASATTSEGLSCTTPCSLDMGRKIDFSVTMTKDGYEPQVVEVRTWTSPLGQAQIAGTLLGGGPLLVGVTAARGMHRDHTPNPVVVDFENPENTSKPAPDAQAQWAREAQMAQ
ncbi:PEGA domain-containing protein [Breoghania sp. L-A4]|uniref:PEGA domain-containing protein n=1 Tax=Breoghania sp. L-A4 TaxID=2304600 RepID=UPI000E35F708|nr:PEGA domain-containing protein [Breoghania sp. L-A4]AXS41074.1 translation initiation factor 2 [Breoghania sp. L-A4]